MSWAPTRTYNLNEECTYGELNTGTWWWEIQNTLPVGSTLIPVLLASDQTHLTQFSGDKKLWPVYISLGNIHSSIRNKPQSHAWIPLAFLPIPPKRIPNIIDCSKSQQSINAQRIFHGAISFLLEPLSDAIVLETGLEILCGDEFYRQCIPRLCAWLADHIENCNIHAVSANRCLTCITPPKQLGDNIDPKDFMMRPAEIYKERWQNYQSDPIANYSDAEELQSDGVQLINNALWHSPYLHPPDLIRADLLHTIYLGLLKHMMVWIPGFLADVRCLAIFDEI